MENTNEVLYLTGMVNEVAYDIQRFNMLIGEDRVLFGVVSHKDSTTPFSKIVQYRTLYNTLIDLDRKIKFSFSNGIEHAYSQKVQDDYSPIYVNTKEEYLSYYYIENALFRTSSLWDLLAQLYRLFYDIDIAIDKVYYSKIFNPQKDEFIVSLNIRLLKLTTIL